MKKLSLIILSTFLLFFCSTVTVHAEGDWVPNPYGLAVVPNAYGYSGAWWTEPPTNPGAVFSYNGQTYVVGGSTQTQTAQVQPQPVQTQQCQPAPQPQVVQPYFYDNAWHSNMPTEASKDYWYNGAWYKTPAAQPTPTPIPTPQKPSAYVDNTANAKAQELVNYAVANGVAGSYADSTDSATVAQKHVTFTGQRGSFDMTLTTHVGSDGNYVTKYWRAGIERTLADVQGWILGCK